MPIKLEGREYRSMTMRALDSPDDGKMIVRGYASTFNDPYTLWEEPGYKVIEQVDARAFDECDMSDVIMQYDHAGRVFARIRNNTLKVEPDMKGLLTEADLGGTDIGRQLYQEIKGGYTDRMSFGFHVKKDDRRYTEDHDTGDITVVRTILAIDKLYDVSAVSLPANDGTSISARNFSDGLIQEIKAERLRAQAIEARKRKIQILIEMEKN